MDNQRLLIWAAFGLLAWFTYQQWIQDYSTPPAESTAPVSEDALSPVTENDELPALQEPSMDAAAPELAPELPEVAAAEPAAGLIRVSTDVFELEIATRGGTIQRATLKNYPVAKDRPESVLRFLRRNDCTQKVMLNGCHPAAARNFQIERPVRYQIVSLELLGFLAVVDNRPIE